MALFFFFVKQVNAQQIIGSWSGKLSVQGTEMPLIFNIKSENQELSSTMDSPSQGATGIPMDETSFVNDTLTIKFKQSGIKYVGVLEGVTMSGTFLSGRNPTTVDTFKN